MSPTTHFPFNAYYHTVYFCFPTLKVVILQKYFRPSLEIFLKNIREAFERQHLLRMALVSGFNKTDVESDSS